MIVLDFAYGGETPVAGGVFDVDVKLGLELSSPVADPHSRYLITIAQGFMMDSVV